MGLYALKLSNNNYVKIIDDRLNFVSTGLDECSVLHYNDAIKYANEINSLNCIKVVAIVKVKLQVESIEFLEIN